MNKFIQVFLYELTRNITRKGYLFATLGIPLVGFAIFYGFPIYQSFQTPDEENNVEDVISELVLETVETAGYVDNSGLFNDPAARFDDVLVQFDDVESAREALLEEEVDVFFIFPEDYLETGDIVLHIRNISLSYVSEGEFIAEQMAYTTFASGLDSLRLQRLSNPAIFTEFNLAVSDEGSTDDVEDGQFLFVYAFMMIFFVALVMTNTYLMQTVVEERDNRLVEILISTVRPSQLIGGKITAMAVLGILQVLIWGIAMGTLFNLAGGMEIYAQTVQSLNIEFRADLLPIMAVYFVLLYLIYAAIFGTIGAVTGSAQEGSNYAGFLILPVIIPSYFFALIQNDPNSLLAIGFSLFPITAPVTTMVRMVITDVPLWQIGTSVVLLALTAFGAIWMAGRIFRVQVLLSGNKLKVSDIPRLIFSEE